MKLRPAFINVFTFSILSVFLLAEALATPKPEIALLKRTELQMLPSNFFDEFYLLESSTFSNSTKIFLEKPEVTFDDEWTKDFRTKVKAKYAERTIESFGHLLSEQLALAIDNSDKFQLVDNKPDADLIFTPAIQDLYINGPEHTDLTKIYVRNAGKGTYNLKILSGNQLVSQIIDRRATRDIGGTSELEKANRVTNYRDFRFLMKKWAKNTMKQLEISQAK